MVPCKNWVTMAVYDCPLGWRGRYNRNRVRKFNVRPWSFVNFANQPIFIFIRSLRLLWPCSTKIWQMTVLQKNLRNDRAPPKFKKWPCSTKKSQLFNFICSLRFLWIFHAWVYQNCRKIKGVIFPKFRASKVLSDLPINQFLFLSAL